MEKKVYINPLTEVTNVCLAGVVLVGSPIPVPPEPVFAPAHPRTSNEVIN